MTQKFIVSVPGRAQPLCIEADSFDRDGWNDGGFTFRQGADVVAQFPSVDLVAKAESMPDFPELSQFLPPEVLPKAMPSHLVPPPPPAMRSLKAKPAKFKVNPSPCWPFLSGLALGLLVGVMGMLVFAIV